MGDYILTQNDVRAEGRFDDLVAYGGWTIDDHHPQGFNYPGEPTIFHPAPSPFGIPYRCLYSKNIGNLFFAGRNISVTHAALSATRVMATCATIGQAVGTAAAIAIAHDLSPRGVYEEKLGELKQQLQDDDCYLPWNKRQVPKLSLEANLTASEGDPEPLRSGVDRPVGDEDQSWVGEFGSWVEYRFAKPEKIRELRFVFDSDFNRKEKNMPASFPLEFEPHRVPKTLVRAFRIEVEQDGEWEQVLKIEDNYQRLARLSLDLEASAVRFVPVSTWGSEKVRVFAWDLA